MVMGNFRHLKICAVLGKGLCYALSGKSTQDRFVRYLDTEHSGRPPPASVFEHYQDHAKGCYQEFMTRIRKEGRNEKQDH